MAVRRGNEARLEHDDPVDRPAGGALRKLRRPRPPQAAGVQEDAGVRLEAERVLEVTAARAAGRSAADVRHDEYRMIVRQPVLAAHKVGALAAESHRPRALRVRAAL